MSEKPLDQKHFVKYMEGFAKTVKQGFDNADKKSEKLSEYAITTRQELTEIQERVATKKQVNELILSIDSVLQKFKKMDQELTSNRSAHDRIQDEIDKIKKQLNPKPAQ